MADGDTLLDDNGDEVLLESGSVHLEKAAVEGDEECCCVEADCGCGTAPPAALNVAFADLFQDISGGVAEQLFTVIGLLSGRNWNIPYLFTYLNEAGNPVCLYACNAKIGTLAGPCLDWLGNPISCDLFLNIKAELSSAGIVVYATIYGPGSLYGSGLIVFQGSVTWSEETPQTCTGPVVIDNGSALWGDANIFGDGTVTVTAASGGADCEEQCGDCPCPCKFKYCGYLRFDVDGDGTIVRGVFVKTSLQTWRLTDVTINGVANSEFSATLYCASGGAVARWRIGWSDGRSGSPLGSGIIGGNAVGCPPETTWELESATVEDLTVPTIAVTTKTAGVVCPDPLGCSTLGDCVAVAFKRVLDGAITEVSFARGLTRDTPGVDIWSGSEDDYTVTLECTDDHFTLTVEYSTLTTFIYESDDGVVWTRTGGTASDDLEIVWLGNCVDRDGDGEGCPTCPELLEVNLTGTTGGTNDTTITVHPTTSLSGACNWDNSVEGSDVFPKALVFFEESAYRWHLSVQPNLGGGSYHFVAPVRYLGECPQDVPEWLYFSNSEDASIPVVTVAAA